MVHDRRSLRGIEQPRAQADQPAGRNREQQMGVFAAVVHLDHSPAADADQFHDRAHLFVRHLDDQRLERLFGDAADLASDDPRLADRKLVTFAAHGLDQHAEVQEAAPETAKHSVPSIGSTRRATFRSSSRISRSRRCRVGDVFARSSGQWRRVHGKDHLQRRLIDGQTRQRLRLFAVS